MKILPTSCLDNEFYSFNEEYRERSDNCEKFNCRIFCPKDFQEGWKVRIELLEYKHLEGSEFIEGIVTNPSCFDEEGTFALELLVNEKFRGRRNGNMPRRYSYYRIKSAELVQLPPA